MKSYSYDDDFGALKQQIPGDRVSCSIVHEYLIQHVGLSVVSSDQWRPPNPESALAIERNSSASGI